MKGILNLRKGRGGWLFLLLGVWTLMMGCGRNAQDGGAVESDTGQGRGKLCVYLYEDFPVDKATKLCAELEKYFPDVELMEKRLSLPSGAYVAGRNRYRGTGLLDDLRKLQDRNVVLGLTNRIICKKNELSPDFGIMGVSYLNSGLCVASSLIPKSQTQQTDENFIKLTLHELGHAYGLPHCPDQKCYMVDAKHKNKFPQTTGFCKECADYLRSAGISLPI